MTIARNASSKKSAGQSNYIVAPKAKAQPEISHASLKDSDIVDSSVSKNETEKSPSRATGETMSEYSDDNPQGGLKSHASLKNSDIIESSVSKNETASSLKKWGGVLFIVYFEAHLWA